MYRYKPRLSQHFLVNPRLVKRLVSAAQISPKDCVLEIGPGKGSITTELLNNAGVVIGVELDADLVKTLRSSLTDHRLLLFQGDFLNFPLPVTPYKVFANPPFNFEGQIIRKLLDAELPPQSIHLVVIRDVARRWCGLPRSSLFSILYGPWFYFRITHTFSRTDFVPSPRIDSVMLNVKAREYPLIPFELKSRYQEFIRTGFSGGARLRHNLRHLVSPTQFSILAQRCVFSPKAIPSALTLSQWVDLFKRTYVKLNLI